MVATYSKQKLHLWIKYFEHLGICLSKSPLEQLICGVEQMKCGYVRLKNIAF